MRSLEQIEKEIYIKPKSSPMDTCGEQILLYKGEHLDDSKNYTLSLDGIWDLNGNAAKVPGSIHTAMFEAGVIPDPYKYRDDDIARELSFKDWYYTKEFSYEGSGNNVYLNFGGIVDRCDIYLNDEHLGFHQGMFAPIEFDITKHIVKGMNALKVHIYPAIDFNNTVVFNCSYGWHYARIWPLGIWENVKIVDKPKVYFDSPFITTKSHETGTMDLSIALVGSDISGTIVGTVKPKNFDGEAYSFMYSVKDSDDYNNIRLTFEIPNFKLWWPNGHGEQNLYSLDLKYVENSIVIDNTSTDFGIRTLYMAPFPSGAKEDTYNRTCVINGRAIFMKGAGYCTIDALMRFETEDYDRILSRAKQQGVNFFRAWGGGLVETDEFYSLCDKYGICVYQEWPCCWDSQKIQPAELIYETIITQTKRIRNRPSLVIYGGGNEGFGAFEDEVLNKMGALTYEYDGTRVFYRQDGGASSKGMTHDHIHWGGEKPEHYITKYGTVKEINMHEYGLDSLMNKESILKYSTLEDVIEWPIDPKGVVAHHTATFNGEYGWNPTPHGYDIDTFSHYSKMFLEPNDLDDLILGSQLAQAMAKYPAIINSRIKWPHCTNVVYYKLNDVYPGASWSVIDWYGAPKIGHYLCQDAFMQLMACGLFDRYNTYDKDSKDIVIPVHVLDDNSVLNGKDYVVTVKAYNSDLNCIKSVDFNQTDLKENSYLGDFVLTEDEANSFPLTITFTLYVDKHNIFRTYMYLNFDNKQGCLFNLPKTTLKWSEINIDCNSILSGYERFNEYGTNENVIIVTNTGSKPAVSVSIECVDEESFVCSDNFFFLESNESKIIRVSDIEKVKGVTCFNLQEDKTNEYIDISMDIKGEAISHNTLLITWNKIEDVNGYAVFVDEKKVAGISNRNTTNYLVKDLNENTKYKISLGIYEGLRLKMCKETISIETDYDMVKPFIQKAYFSKPDMITLIFSKEIQVDSSCFDIENMKINSIKVEGNKINLELNTKVDVNKGVTLYLSNIHDNTAKKNILENTEVEIKPMLKECGSYKYGEGTVVIKDYDFSIKENAVISMHVKPEQVEGQYQVLFARGPKGGIYHFEFYTDPAGNLKMYSSKGDHMLGVNLKEYENSWFKLVIVVENLFVNVYVNDKRIYHGEDRLAAEDGVLDITLGSLVDSTLVFKGELDNVRLYSGIPEMII